MLLVTLAINGSDLFETEDVFHLFCDACRTFVSFGMKERAMGNSAKTQLISNMKNTVWGWKKFIGRMYRDPCVAVETPALPYQVSEGANGTIAIKVGKTCFL